MGNSIINTLSNKKSYLMFKRGFTNPYSCNINLVSIEVPEFVLTGEEEDSRNIHNDWEKVGKYLLKASEKVVDG